MAYHPKEGRQAGDPVVVMDLRRYYQLLMVSWVGGVRVVGYWAHIAADAAESREIARRWYGRMWIQHLNDVRHYAGGQSEV